MPLVLFLKLPDIHLDMMLCSADRATLECRFLTELFKC